VFGLLGSVDRVAPLIGRRSELRLLTDVVTGAPGANVVVVIGEAGVGKTRLTGAVTEQARLTGVTVLKGDCLPLTDSVPFLPIAEVLRALVAASPLLLKRCSPAVRSEVLRLIPDQDTEAVVREQGPVAGWQRGRLFSALRDLLVAAADDGAFALLVEDLHWADSSTLDFLAYLCAVDQDGVTPIVLTCRAEESGPSRPVGRWIAEIARRHGVTRLPLDRLSRREVAEQIGGLLDAAPSPEAVDEVFARAGGNPFFTEQLVAAGRGENGVELPASLADLLISRAEAVGDDGRAVLAALAVAGRGLDDALLTAITGLDRRGLAAAVRQLIEAHLIGRPDAEGRFQLRHALLGEAVTADMLAGDRRDRHAAVARALTRARSLTGAAGAGTAGAREAGTGAAGAREAGAGEVAEHWAAAGELAEEMPWRVTAAGEAERMYAYREAATHWQRVIDLWSLAPGVRPAGLDLAAVYLRALAALDRCGDSRTARPLAEQAVTVTAPTADPRRLALLHDRLFTYRAVAGDRTAVAHLETALRLLEDLAPGREHAMVLHSYAMEMTNVGAWSGARPYLIRALGACRAEGSAADDIRIKVLRDLGVSVMHDGDIDSGMRQLAEAAALAEEIGDLYGGLGVTFWHTVALSYLNRLEQAAAAMAAGLRTAHRAGLDATVFGEFLTFHYVKTLAELGRPFEAAPLVPASPEPTPNAGIATARAYLDLLAGDHVAVAERITAIEAVVSPMHSTHGDSLIAYCEIDLWRGRSAQALRRIQRSPDGLDPAAQWTYIGPILVVAMRACGDLVEAARARRDRAGEQEARRVAEDLVDRHAVMRPDPFAAHPFCATAAAGAATWTAELTRVRGVPDSEAWATAAASWAALGRPHRAAYARWRQAEAFLSGGGRTGQARDSLRAALAGARDHAPLTAEIRSLARLARLDLRDDAPVAEPPGPAPAPYGLTDREMMVLGLLADGLSNVEIGARLFISGKTASVHVTNILRKLGVKNRTEAAALAQRAGLLRSGLTDPG
jgi:DNA-binding CsgD family transcriptional regulator